MNNKEICKKCGVYLIDHITETLENGNTIFISPYPIKTEKLGHWRVENYCFVRISPDNKMPKFELTKYATGEDI